MSDPHLAARLRDVQRLRSEGKPIPVGFVLDQCAEAANAMDALTHEISRLVRENNELREEKARQLRQQGDAWAADARRKDAEIERWRNGWGKGVHGLLLDIGDVAAPDIDDVNSVEVLRLRVEAMQAVGAQLREDYADVRDALIEACVGVTDEVDPVEQVRILRVELQRAKDTAMRLSELAAEKRDENERLREELETERMRLAACGVVAMADTPESAIKARAMRHQYRSASCDDVARRVDECIRLREELAAAQQESKMILKEAERYRKVRRDPSMLLHLRNSEFDAAIDAAMAQEKRESVLDRMAEDARAAGMAVDQEKRDE